MKMQNNVAEHHKQVLEIYHGIRSGEIKKFPNLTSEVKASLLSKMTGPQKKYFEEVDFKSVNAFISLAKKTNEKDFISFLNDPESVAVKLSPAEMEALKAGSRTGRGILIAASCVATLGSIGLSWAGCCAGLIIHSGLYP